MVAVVVNQYIVKPFSFSLLELAISAGTSWLSNFIVSLGLSKLLMLLSLFDISSKLQQRKPKRLKVTSKVFKSDLTPSYFMALQLFPQLFTRIVIFSIGNTARVSKNVCSALFACRFVFGFWSSLFRLVGL